MWMEWFLVIFGGLGFGVGVVIHDHEGRVAAAVSKKLLQPLGPLEIEANAMEI